MTMLALNAHPFYCAGNLHPFALCSLAYLMGIWWQTTHEPLLLFCTLLLSCFVFAYCQLHAWRTLLVPPLIIGFFALGSVRIAQLYTSITQLHQLHANTSYTATGIITETRRYEHPFFTQQHIVALQTGTSLHNNKKQHDMNGLYATVYTRATTSCMVGDQIVIPRLVMMKNDDQKSTTFTARTKIIATVFDSADRCTTISRPSWSYTRFMHATREKIHKALTKALAPTTKILFATIFLGERVRWRTHPKLMGLFGLWGLNHHLARSGLHVVLLLVLWLFFLSLLPVRAYLKRIMICFLALTYYALSWPSLSFNRAMYALFAHQLSSYLCTPFDSLHTVATSALLFTLVNPAYALSLDFQLTFGLTYALAWLNYAQTRNRQRSLHKNVASR